MPICDFGCLRPRECDNKVGLGNVEAMGLSVVGWEFTTIRKQAGDLAL